MIFGCRLTGAGAGAGVGFRALSLLYGFAIIIFLASCTGSGESNADSGSPGRRFHLSENQIVEEENKAAKGDAAAVGRLSNHYQWAVSDQSKAMAWLRRGVELNDPWAMINLSSLIAVKADETSCQEAERLLLRALLHKTLPGVVNAAKADLETLRNGVDGAGYCSRWLRPK
ncbi:hypothetical protein [Lysobacter capsici]|uniref:hypothetical protein n=1 Tax=Lysobacter capsici TaxID=435897 RepID=UPI00287B9051|nr:hypothetical protein [Lysobacter capsici]WND81751.1 hypothetical protein RJ610_05125 [Lysobacter capsici]WND86947.1 hypothetical protein RJ609_05125 [Lysobacter capsici]